MFFKLWEPSVLRLFLCRGIENLDYVGSMFLRPKRRIFDADFIMANAASRAVRLCHDRCARAGPLFYSRGDDKGLAGRKYRSGSRFGC